jgi:hypothetical protein
LLKPRHVSATQEHLQGVNHIQGKFHNSYIHVYIYKMDLTYLNHEFLITN